MLGIETGVAGADGAAALPGIARCVALEDSATGIASAVASGATTIAQLGFNRNAKADGPQCASIDGFAGITACRELAEADRDGRLVVLPAKTVFELTWDAGPDCDLICPVSVDGEGCCSFCDKGELCIYERSAGKSI